MLLAEKKIIHSILAFLQPGTQVSRGKEIMSMSSAQELDQDMLEQATGGAGESVSAPKCPVCGSVMQPSGIVVNGKPVSGKWVCPKCKYTVTKS